MKHAFKSLVAVTAVASIFAVAGTAAAADPNTKCHQTIAKSIGKYQATLAKGLVGCHKSRTGGKVVLGSDCNETGVTGQGADQKSKRGANRTKTRDKISTTCEGLAPSVDPLYVACPSPVDTSDDGGATTEIDTYFEVADCLMDLSEHYIEVIGERTMGNPTLPATETMGDCQDAIGKALSKYVKTVQGSRAKCQAGTEKTNPMDLTYGLDCATGDSTGKIVPAEQALLAAFTTSCPGSMSGEYDDLGFCTGNLQTPTLAALTNCALTEVAIPITNGIAGASQALLGVYDAVADVTISAANSEVKIVSNTRLDTGWKGSGHKIDVIDQSIGAVSISNCDSDGRFCDVSHNPKNGNCRCEGNATIECEEIEGQNPACPDVDLGPAEDRACHCMFGPPLAISASNTPVCVVNRFAEDFTGNTIGLGEYEVGTRTRALVHTGLSASQPCPICVGDPTPNDGVLGGACDGGPRDTLACDENANHPDFGPSSFDCPPSPGANFSGEGLNLDLVFESGPSTINAGIPAGPFCGGGGPCHCQVCTGDSAVGCQVDADCSAVGAGTCGVALANNPSQHACDTSCSDDDGDLNLGEPEDSDNAGSCDGPIDQFCDGFLNGFGDPIINCTTNGQADCDANDCNGDLAVTPGECGNCTEGRFRKCYLPTVTATGTPGIFESEGVSVFCSGQTGGSVDNAGGLPGPGRVKLTFDFDLFCSDGATRYQLPGGPNCPAP